MLDEKRDLATVLRETGHGVITVGARNRMVHATPGGPECLARFFPDAPADAFVRRPRLT